MKIRWLGTAALEIKTGSSIILIDPWLSRFKKAYPPAPNVNRDMIEKADYIFISHGHFDHFEDTPYLVEKTGAQVFVSERAAKFAIEQKNLKEEKVTSLLGDEKLEFEDFNVQVINGKHIDFDFKTIISKIFNPYTYSGAYRILKRGQLKWPKGDVLGYLFDLFVEEKPIKFMLFGSLGWRDDLFEGKESETDILAMPIAGRREAWKNALKYIDLFNPEIVIPTHWDDAFPPFSDYYMNQIDKLEEKLKNKQKQIDIIKLEINKEREINL
ncbi:MAG: MBL fold metallo-hydrolase [Candidatus Lokiarchaeota archaeon]|nr:MBL fold metallo-hydrolase [Candidatus Lokiarchaeota archaeon]